MTAVERLLAYFDRISEAQDAVPRLRSFALDLAVRGKLVEQDPSDEPAATLVARIAAEKAAVSLGRRTRRDKASESANSGPFDLPRGWTWSSLAQVGYINPRNTAAEDHPASFIPMTLISADYRVPVKHVPTTWAEIRSGYTHLANGDVALAKITPCFENGKSAVIRDLTGGIGAGTTELHVVRPVVVNPDFLLAFLKSRSFIHAGIPRMTGTAGQKRVPGDYFAHAPLPLPPVAEQQRIVLKVNELMALCDRLEATQQERERRREKLVTVSLARLSKLRDLEQLSRLLEHRIDLQGLRGAILDLAVRGALEVQDSREESAEAWLAAAGRPSVAAAPRHEPTPSGWAWREFGELFEVAGGIQKTPHRAPKSNSYPYLGVANVYRGRLDLSVVKRFELQPGELPRKRLEAGDLLVIEGNGSFKEIGRCAKWNGEIPDCVHQNHVIRCRPFDTSIADFVLMFLNSPAGIAAMQHLAITSSGLYSLSVGKIRRIQVPVPPVLEQRRIVARVAKLMSLCDQLETMIEARHSAQGALLEATLRAVLEDAAVAAPA